MPWTAQPLCLTVIDYVVTNNTVENGELQICGSGHGPLSIFQDGLNSSFLVVCVEIRFGPRTALQFPRSVQDPIWIHGLGTSVRA
jgi:hypothetical protein